VFVNIKERTWGSNLVSRTRIPECTRRHWRSRRRWNSDIKNIWQWIGMDW